MKKKISRGFVVEILRVAHQGTINTKKSPQEVASYLMTLVLDLNEATDGWNEDGLSDEGMEEEDNE